MSSFSHQIPPLGHTLHSNPQIRPSSLEVFLSSSTITALILSVHGAGGSICGARSKVKDLSCWEILQTGCDILSVCWILMNPTVSGTVNRQLVSCFSLV